MTVLKFFVAVVGMSALPWGGLPAPSAHEMTEMYIPVGLSPGLSGKYAVIGTIRTVNAHDQTVVVVGPTGTWSAKVTGRTKIWLDRSTLRLTNLTGVFSDLRPGLTVEVKHEAHRRGVPSGPADWIKVRVPASP